MLAIRIHGRGGQGAQVACQLLAAAFFRAGREVQAGVEDQSAGRMQHQPAGYGNADLAGFAFEEEPEICLEPAAGEREEPDRHRRGR